MRRSLLLFSVSLLTVATIPLPPTPEPVFELHRTENADFIDPLNRNPLFILVLGSDVREGDPFRGRADSIHIVAVNTKTGKGTIIGIPRDALVGGRKINAYLLGGGQAMTDVVKRLTGLPIHYWAAIEFSRFRRLIDKLGGLEVNVPYPMVDRFSGANFKKGVKKMNGEQVLAFSRNRKTVPGGDFGRSENHGRVLLAALDKFRGDARDPFTTLKYFREFRGLVKANVPIEHLIRLAEVARRLEPKNFRNVVVPAASGSSGGASVQILGGGARQIFDAVRDDGVL